MLWIELEIMYFCSIKTKLKIMETNTQSPRRGVCDTIDRGVCDTPLRSPSKTLGSIVRGFKSAVTKQIGFPVWQRNYHEHIIRNANAFTKISNYILNNPAQWHCDMFNND